MRSHLAKPGPKRVPDVLLLGKSSRLAFELQQPSIERTSETPEVWDRRA